MNMPGRGFESDEHRFGFNGMEQDDEVKGAGNSLNFGARVYDARVGRWLRVDPDIKPNESSYIGLANSPIFIIDLFGEDSLIIHRSAPIYDAKTRYNYYDITVSVIRNKVETILPIRYKQVTNDDYVQQSENSFIPLVFQQMDGHDGERWYENTIFVKSIKRKENGKPFYTFMHPADYRAWFLNGCMVTCEKFLENGAPDIGDGEYYQDPDYSEKAMAATAEPLAKFRELYEKYNIGDSNGNFKGNDFLMRTNSLVKYVNTRTKYNITPIDVRNSQNPGINLDFQIKASNLFEEKNQK